MCTIYIYIYMCTIYIYICICTIYTVYIYYAFIHLYVYICPYTFHDDVMFFHDALTRISQLFDKEGLHFLLFEA